MKNKNVWGTCLAIILVACGAAAQQSGTPPKPAEGRGAPSTSASTAATPPGAESSQKVVLKVGATQVTQSEIDSLVSRLGSRAKVTVATQGRRPVGEEYVKMLVLSHRALDEHLDSTPTLHSQLELQRDQTLAEAEYQKMASEVKISPDDVSEYFTAHHAEFETVQVREFLIRKRPQGADPKVGFTAEDAKAQAESIRTALLAGTDPDKVAETFADPPRIILVDQKPRTLRRAEMVPALEKATFELKDGGVSEPVDTPQALLVVKLLKHQRPELKEVATEVENKLRQQKLDAQIDDLKKKAGVWMDDDYFKNDPVATPRALTAQPQTSDPTAAPNRE
jgi:PPIC-type PPIASE domain